MRPEMLKQLFGRRVTLATVVGTGNPVTHVRHALTMGGRHRAAEEAVSVQGGRETGVGGEARREAGEGTLEAELWKHRE